MAGSKESMTESTNITIGLDVGGSTTKVIGIQGTKFLEPCRVTGSDPVSAAYGGIGKFLNVNDLKLSQVSCLKITGVGVSYLKAHIFDKETICVPEFEAVGIGGLYSAHLTEAVVVSMGTGTSIVRANAQGVTHLIGSGVGGGTILGLAKEILDIDNPALISSMAEQGDVTKVDLSVGDITVDPIPGLKPETTAANFAKIDDTCSKVDLASGIVNLCFQSVGTAAVLAARSQGLEDIVFVGSVLEMEAGRKILQEFASLYKLRIHVPPEPKYSTAMGAALFQNKDFDCLA